MKLALLFAGAFIAGVAALFKTDKGAQIMNTMQDTANTATDLIQNDANAIVDTAASLADTAQNAVLDNVVAPVATAFGTQYDALIRSSAEQYGIDPKVLYNLLYTESHFRADIISGKTKSRVGALGIAQFMPATAQQELGSVDAALDPNIAIPGAARYLAKLIHSAGSVSGGVAAYNWGIGNVLHKGLSKAPPETVAYVAGITGDSIA